MDKSVPEQQSSTPQETKRVILFGLGRILKWLASFMQLTEAEEEEAGIMSSEWTINEYGGTLHR